MWQVGGANIYRRVRVAPLQCSEEKRVFKHGNRASERSAEFVEIEIRIRIIGLGGRGKERRLGDFVAQIPRGEGGVLIVVKKRSVIIGSSAFCRDADIGDARVFGCEVVRQHRNVSDGFERRLAGRGLSKHAAVGALPVKRETCAVTLGTDKLESAIRICLRDIGI